jgi:hypothetical protein
MRKLLSSPAKMALNDAENAIYQNALKHVTELSLNLIAVKVENRPEDFLGWCAELVDVCRNRINMDLLEKEQLPSLKKLEETLVRGATVSQFKMARIAPWPIFKNFIEQQAGIHALDERFGLLTYIDRLNDKTLAEMTELERQAYAGKHTNQHCYTQYDFDVEWFASTKGAKIFHTLLSNQPEKFDKALSYIPLNGDVTPKQYQDFVKAYQKIFNEYTVEKPAGEKASLAPATRLLSMKRPDQFIALTNAKIDVICQGLAIPKFNGFDFNSYWQDMIGTLRTFAWWHHAEPDNQEELNIWRSRAILVDLFMYADEDFALSSNYLRLRDKTAKHSESTYKPSSRARIKLTPEEVVDQAITADGIPEYIQAKRDTILKEVKAGKNVEHVIGLMRAIFG